MKKNIFGVVLAVLSMTVAVSFTSCGGNDEIDDNLDKVEQEQSGVLGYKYVAPCLQWNATQDEVASYMSGIGGWDLKERGPQTGIWLCNYPTTEIAYVYGVGLGITGLYSVQVTYYSGKESEFADLRANIEKDCNCTLQMNATNVNTYTAENVKINGRKTNITVRSYNTGGISYMGVIYSLSY